MTCCLCVVGGFSFSFACVFETMGFSPFSVISCPNHVILFLAKCHLSILIARFSSFRMFRVMFLYGFLCHRLLL